MSRSSRGISRLSGLGAYASSAIVYSLRNVCRACGGAGDGRASSRGGEGGDEEIAGRVLRKRNSGGCDGIRAGVECGRARVARVARAVLAGSSSPPCDSRPTTPGLVNNGKLLSSRLSLRPAPCPARSAFARRPLWPPTAGPPRRAAFALELEFSPAARRTRTVPGKLHAAPLGCISTSAAVAEGSARGT